MLHELQSQTVLLDQIKVADDTGRSKAYELKLVKLLNDSSRQGQLLAAQLRLANCGT